MKFFFSKNEDGHEVAEEIVMVNETLDVPGVDTVQQEIAAAIAVALQLYKDSIKEEEKTMMAIQKLMKTHSPWASKSNLLRQQPLYLLNRKAK